MSEGSSASPKLAALEETLSVTFHQGLDRGAISRAIEARAPESEQERIFRAGLGIADQAVVERLMELGVSEEGLVALSLTPLVAVAWADGNVDAKERKAVLAAACEQGLKREDVGYLMLEGRLRERPSTLLIESWIAYLEVLAELLDPAARQRLREQVLGRAKRVAEASGGLLGLGEKISPSEQRVFERLERVLGSPA